MLLLLLNNSSILGIRIGVTPRYGNAETADFRSNNGESSCIVNLLDIDSANVSRAQLNEESEF